jgi:hypothetical protein
MSVSVQDRDILLGFIQGIRPYVDFSSATLVWQEESSSDGLSPPFRLEIGHVVRCGDEMYIVGFYYSSVSDEDVNSSDDV